MKILFSRRNPIHVSFTYELTDEMKMMDGGWKETQVGNTANALPSS
jgi:hypothetical protein